MRGVSKIKKSPVTKNDFKMTSKCLPFWMLLASYWTKSAFQKGTRKYTKKCIQKLSKKDSKRDETFVAEMALKSQKSEPWAQNGAPSLQERSPGTQNTQKSSKMSSKITQNSENLVTQNQENPTQKKPGNGTVAGSARSALDKTRSSLNLSVAKEIAAYRSLDTGSWNTRFHFHYRLGAQ